MQNKENKNNEIQFEIKIQQYFCFSLQVNAFSLFQKDISLIDQTCQSNEYFFFFLFHIKVHIDTLLSVVWRYLTGLHKLRPGPH